jgi:hypothetical protein
MLVRPVGKKQPLPWNRGCPFCYPRRPSQCSGLQTVIAFHAGDQRSYCGKSPHTSLNEAILSEFAFGVKATSLELAQVVSHDCFFTVRGRSVTDGRQGDAQGASDIFFRSL